MRRRQTRSDLSLRRTGIRTLLVESNLTWFAKANLSLLAHLKLANGPLTSPFNQLGSRRIELLVACEQDSDTAKRCSSIATTGCAARLFGAGIVGNFPGRHART
jgi:hypothetical protein